MTDQVNLGALLVGLVAVISLAVLNTKLVDYFFEPLKRKFPDVDWFFIQYVSAATGIAIGVVSGLNLFTLMVPTMAPILGRILTAVLIGAGSSVIHDWVDTELSIPGDGW